MKINKVIPELPEKYTKMENSLAKVLKEDDKSGQRFKERIKKIHNDRYYRKWKAKNIINRLYSTTYPSKENEKPFEDIEN